MSITDILPEHDLGTDLASWVRLLVVEFPRHDEYDLAAIVEERSGKRVRRAEFEVIRATYLRTRFQVYQPEDEEE